jgi:hypothetical protein
MIIAPTVHTCHTLHRTLLRLPMSRPPLTEEEVDAAIEEAIQHIRRHKD